MKLKKPENPNYCFTVVKVGKDIDLEDRDRIVHKNVFGNMVITSKDVYPEGTLMLYIPVECQLSEDYCKYNNLYDKSDMNADPLAKGYISYKKRRIRAIKLGGYESNGMLMPLGSLAVVSDISKDEYLFTKLILNKGNEFDEINGIKLCNKYIPTPSRNSNPKGKAPKKHKWESKMVDSQFKFHKDTTHLGKNIHKINPDDIISITEKLHGTSGISSKVLVKRKLNWVDNILLALGIQVVKTCYDNEGIYASRKVIKNEELNPKANDYYKEDNDWRKLAHESVFPFLAEGMTAYYEIVGYTPSGSMIQKGFDYGFFTPQKYKVCLKTGKTERLYEEGINFGVFIYRLTYTNTSGQVFEFSAKQVQDWCRANDLKAVPERYYGDVWGLMMLRIHNDVCESDYEDWREELLIILKEGYWRKQCTMCKSKVPNEGVVLRKEGLGCEAYKHKNFDFLQFESKQLDKE